MSNPTKPAAKPIRILALCDSVARAGNAITGFGRVAHNLFIRWSQSLGPDAAKEYINPIPGPMEVRPEIDIWAIGFDGQGYKGVPREWTLLPAGDQWQHPARLAAFLKRLASGSYTHVFILMDADALSGVKFPGGHFFSDELRRICREKGIRSLLYYPVDAPLLPPYDLIGAVDVAVTFTEYGREETRKAFGKKSMPIHVLPHGMDDHFTPVSPEERIAARAEFLVDGAPADPKGKKPFLKPGDYLILNVGKNEWRKDPLRSLEILRRLIDAGVPAKLVMRMNPTSLMGGIHLERAAEQLGLRLDREWAHIGAVPESHMRRLYGAADLLLTTSLGEGWGLPVTEALACGTPVVLPMHTSLMEIGDRIGTEMFPEDEHAVRFLPLETGHVCGYDTRLRQRVELVDAVQIIRERWMRCQNNNLRVTLPPTVRQWLSWDRIAGEMLKLLLA